MRHKLKLSVYRRRCPRKVHEDSERISVAEINTLYRDGGKDANLLKRAAKLEAQPESWRDYLREELKSLEHTT